ncbi:unnamed protein product [Linum trigynum]|uniref:Uncharacterized protein n=1 Tax=Linum trigynum TaxID=586398 RepID=A0AAV2DSF4_9ROSI
MQSPPPSPPLLPADSPSSLDKKLQPPPPSSPLPPGNNSSSPQPPAFSPPPPSPHHPSHAVLKETVTLNFPS